MQITLFSPFVYLLIVMAMTQPLVSKVIETFYGPIKVNENILVELIESPAMQRLKHINQYGVAYYTTHNEKYTRYDHSLGVFALLRRNNCSLKEQIAGLLHDVSHTAFSHVGDWIFNKQNQEKDYQNSIHDVYLKNSGLEKILNKYHISIDEIMPIQELFPALECSLPSMCADRLDYNIQGAYHRGWISYEEAIKLFKSYAFTNHGWVTSELELMRKVAYFSLFMTIDCWGGPTNHLMSKWLANAILRAVELGDLSFQDIHFGVDQTLWEALMQHEDDYIQKNMDYIMNAESYFSLEKEKDSADMVIQNKFRGINPLIHYQGKIRPLREIDILYDQNYQKTQSQCHKGWNVRLFNLQRPFANS